MVFHAHFPGWLEIYHHVYFDDDGTLGIVQAVLGQIP